MPNSTTRTPATDTLYSTTNGRAHKSQQFCNLLYNKFTTNGQKFATSQHLDMSRCWALALRCGKFLFVGVVVQQVRSRRSCSGVWHLRCCHHAQQRRCESSLGSFDKIEQRQVAADTVQGFKPANVGCWSACELLASVPIHHDHLLLSLSPKADTHFADPRRVEGRVVQRGGDLSSFLRGITTKTMTHGSCDARSTVTFPLPATEHHRRLTSII